MKNGILNLTLLGLLSLFVSCNEDDDTVIEDGISSCDSTVIIDSEQYVNAVSDEVAINSLSIEDDCLTVNFSASGCDGSSWVTELIDSEEVVLIVTNDAQFSDVTSARRRLSFILEDQELCEAFITEEVSFDISSLQVEGETSVELKFLNDVNNIVYEYGTEEETPSCDSVVIIDSEQYANASTDGVTINSIVIENDCLTVNFSGSGCGGETWSTELIDSSEITFLQTTDVPITARGISERMLSFVLDDQEECEAYLTQEVSFDISGLQIEEEDEVLLHFNNFNESVLYEYGTEEISSCDLTVIVDSEKYKNVVSDDVTVNSIVIENDCLLVNYSASGCTGETWNTELIDSNEVTFLSTADEPTTAKGTSERTLSFGFSSQEICQAYITKQVSFNISSLQVEGENEVLLNFNNFNESVLYEYGSK